jgi:hypothetical protein
MPNEKSRIEELASIKEEFIQKVKSEDSLDTLREWLYMYDEARYVASIHSDEPKLIEEYAQTMESFKHGWGNNCCDYNKR